ncbi:glycosyltransferase 87 family protein [Leifsonia shinshuensis]|uniref:DUF2029 domain-containing protein n=1 Tax=Leifsonia shinshuensis TaxID=150026 RepID=A0A7G6YDU7_9MICO|nr:glycosyltransferase 87 family protein [Leifsonia shinshuensis]QNE36662.1 DUF2029 domain-containing protein [Leifsonia shinshuensis]
MSAVYEAVENDVATPALSWFGQRRNLVSAFVVLHVMFLVALGPAIVTGDALGDLPLYRTWVLDAFQYGQWPGITEPWVYPVGALAPLLAASVAGPALFQLIWFLLITVLNGAAVRVLIREGSTAGYRAAWWWLAFVLVMSPVALLRLEGFTAPLVIIALTVLARRPAVAAALLTVAAWIKVWPAAVLLAAVIGFRRRRPLILAALGVTALVVGTIAALGGARFLTGFLTTQTERGLQLEAPITTPWLWLADLHVPNTYVWQNNTLSTEEVSGPGDSVAAAVIGYALPIALLLVAFLLIRAVRARGPEPVLVVLGSLALVTTLVVFNKVGSPQYVLWIAPVVAVLIRTDPRAARIPSMLLLVIAGLTTLIFPILYIPLTDGDPVVAAILTVRNALFIVLLGWSIRRLFALSRPAAAAEAAEAVEADGSGVAS